MRLFITGAGGFLGRHVLASPAAAGCTLLHASRALRAATASEVPLGPGPWSRGDFARGLAAAQPDVVLHLAGATGSTDRRGCFEANTILAAELLAAVEDMTQPPRVVLVGSAAEYGFVPATGQPVAETHFCCPVTDYGIAKYAQTLLGLAAAARGLPVLVARLFNPVGVGMPSHLALPSFARQLGRGMESAPVIRTGNLDVRRDFLDVEEAARLLLTLAMRAEWPWPVVNLCSGRSHRLRDLLDGLIAASGVSARIEVNSALLRPGEMPELVGSTGRLRDIGLEPRATNFDALFPRLLTEVRGAASA